MRRVLGPLTAGTTWRRAAHLATGLAVAVVCGMVWPGLPDASLRTTAGLLLAPLPLLAVLACVPAVRPAEALQARELLGLRTDDGAVEPSRGLADRGRVLLWLVLRVALGVLAGTLTALGVRGVAAVVRAVPGGPAGVLAGAAAGVGAAVLLAHAVSLLGALAGAGAGVLVGPSPAERLAAERARSERLLERARLAAELHDSIGHALTVTVLQAAAARERAGSDPAFVARALAAIEDSARAAAADLDRVLGLLREPAPRAADAPTLADLDRLLGSARAAGADVDVEVEGRPADLPADVSREGYRILQEALTNALRHAGPVPLQVRISAGAELVLSVRNPLPAAVPAGGRAGRGLPGLRERAAGLGGRAEAGPDGDAWQVSVRLPGAGRP